MTTTEQRFGPVPLRSASPKPVLTLIRGRGLREEGKPLLEVFRGDEATANMNTAMIVESLFATIGIDIVEFATRRRSEKDYDVLVGWAEGSAVPTEAERRRLNILYDATQKIKDSYGLKTAHGFWKRKPQNFKETPVDIIANSTDTAAARRSVMAMIADENLMRAISYQVNRRV